MPERAAAVPTLPDWIRSNRQACGMTRKDLGDRCGISQAMVSHWENGRARPREEDIPTLQGLFRSGAPPPADIFRRTEPASHGPAASPPTPPAHTGCDRPKPTKSQPVRTTTYSEPTLPSSCIRHVLVGGVPVLRDGEIVEAAFPGRPFRGPRSK